MMKNAHFNKIIIKKNNRSIASLNEDIATLLLEIEKKRVDILGYQKQNDQLSSDQCCDHKLSYSGFCEYSEVRCKVCNTMFDEFN